MCQTPGTEYFSSVYKLQARKGNSSVPSLETENYDSEKWGMISDGQHVTIGTTILNPGIYFCKLLLLP